MKYKALLGLVLLGGCKAPEPEHNPGTDVTSRYRMPLAGEMGERSMLSYMQQMQTQQPQGLSPEERNYLNANTDLLRDQRNYLNDQRMKDAFRGYQEESDRMIESIRGFGETLDRAKRVNSQGYRNAAEILRVRERNRKRNR